MGYLEKALRIETRCRVAVNPAGTRLNLCAVLSQALALPPAAPWFSRQKAVGLAARDRGRNKETVTLGSCLLNCCHCNVAADGGLQLGRHDAALAHAREAVSILQVPVSQLMRRAACWPIPPRTLMLVVGAQAIARDGGTEREEKRGWRN